MNKKDKVSSKNIQLNKEREIKNNKRAMNRKTKEEIGTIEDFEDTTKYGEFVSSYFAWLTLEGQKQNARRMEKMTDRDKN